MMDRRLLATCSFSLAVMFAPGFLPAASADVVSLDNFALTVSGATAFEDTFSAGLTLAGGAVPGTVLPSGVNFSNGSPGLYSVIGMVKESGNKARLSTGQGALLVQPPPFFPHARANIVTLLTGPPGSPFSLTPSDVFTTTTLFDLSVPSTPGGFYQINLSDRVASNMGKGDVISVMVHNCMSPGLADCGGFIGKFVALEDANFATGTVTTIARVPLDTSNQQILLELSHLTAGSDTVVGSYAYVNGGIEGPLTTIGSYSGLFTGPGTLGYTQTGFVQLAPVPEPSSLTLLASSIPGILGLAWFRRRRAGGHGPKIEMRT